MEYSPRIDVLQIGSLDIDPKHFHLRGLRLSRVGLTDVADKLNNSRAILVAEKPGHLGFIRQCLTQLPPLADDYGLPIVLIAATSENSRLIRNMWQELKLHIPQDIYVLEAGLAVENAAEHIRNQNPGPPLGNPKILSPNTRLPQAIRHLLQRAFCDCDRIYLESLTGGKASVGVFCVHAWLKRSIVGPRPLPFFIKVDKSDRIQPELQHYYDFADFFIPFYLRPNIDRERCIHGQQLSALVGNFVEGAVPLRTALRTSHGAGILFSLFETSLKGFRAQPSDKRSRTEIDLATFVLEKAKAGKVKMRTIRRAKELGLRSTPQDLELLLVNSIKGLKLPACTYHGDLHTGNVMVRSRDAILIDFFNVTDGPLAADPAALEVSLVFGADEHDRLEQFGEWKRLVDDAYGREPIHQPPRAERRPDSSSWLRRAIREIRHVLLGCDCEHHEAAAILATYLIRFARLADFGSKALPKQHNTA